MPGWRHNYLAAAVGAPPLGAWTLPTAYAFDAQGTLHVAYASDGHIHELWRDGSGWHYNDLTLAAGAPEAQWVREPAGYVFKSEGTQHFVYFSDYHIHELWWNGNGWHHNDLTAITGAPKAFSDPIGYAFEAQGTQHVIFSGDDQHIHELWWDHSGGWHRNT